MTVATDTKEASLYDQLGGAAAVDATVENFYRRVLGDPLLSPFFADTDMERQIRKQKTFLTMAFGGPANYSGEGLRSAHSRAREQGMGEKHFDAVVGHLRETLQELEVASGLIGRVEAICDSVRADVLGR
ncbi:group 1 truncated hemoglobin [Alkalilimnicola ehrlichii]|uniref:Group 1 truncated hemoglobin n=1 Tax=Alkalilimnicola ehrlichii TaxID=351052 RepID=A0A3E0WLA5_9GAMM|nr:group 1 truncated hemoglobin [Alkalilimnicola ehrlichii]RFA32715.1 group 1 truncated hemoglobin [Alkalilimnicola ehrlichii]